MQRVGGYVALLALATLVLVVVVVAQDELLVQPGRWVQMQTATTGAKPDLNYGGAMVGFENKVYVYGHRWNDPNPGDYPFPVQLWSLEISQNGTVGAEENDWQVLMDRNLDTIITTDKPSRWFPGWALHNDRFYMYGGVKESSVWYHDMLTYDIGTDTWNRYNVTAGDAPPSDGQSHSITSLGDGTFITFGGCGNPVSPNFPNSNDFFKYNSNSNSWENLDILNHMVNADGVEGNETVTGVYLNGRCGHSADLVSKFVQAVNPVTNATETVEKKYVLIFGGHGNGGIVDDFWQYDIEANTIQMIPLTGVRPVGRSYHGTAVVNNILFVFGGDTNARDHVNDLWAYSIEFNKWIEIDARGELPPFRAHHQFAAVPDSRALVVYGGLAHAPNGDNTFLDDVWLYGIGCANDCSGQGNCLAEAVCDCEICYGGFDCSTRINNDPSCVKSVDIEDENNSSEGSVGALIGALVGAIVGALCLCCCLALLFTLLALALFHRWKKKQGSAAAGGDDL